MDDPMREAVARTCAERGLLAGDPYPLGATVTGAGVNIAVFSEHGTGIELCLYDGAGLRELARVPLPASTDGVWHGCVPGAGDGLVYGLRAHGPDDPGRGHRFNPAKLLLDPYARAFAGDFRWTDAHLGDAHASEDNARDMIKAVVVDPAIEAFDWGDDRPPRTPLADTVLYEVHVKGFTRLHPDVPEALRGTYEGLVSPATIAHLKRLGITAVSLLPVHLALDEMPLVRRGAVNYWGYNTAGFFMPTHRYARDGDPRQARDGFRRMVKALHQAGIEVILDVVYNHTCEGDQRGPTLSWRGLDNASYYRLRHDDARLYENHTGTGNTLNLAHPRVLQMVMDSLRFWVDEMHVDGFRFDLATSLARGDEGFDRRAPLLQCLAQDPVLAGVKLIAEPWDIGPGGYQVGQFPSGWSEWNDKYRDTVRAFWVQKTADRGKIASRLSGTSELFRHGTRRPQASINYVASHDGFTLQDLVSYDAKHNLDNGEENRDGTDNNLSWNCGEEGPTTLLAIRALRSRLQRALIGTLMLSQGVPMLLGGDEMGRTQRGNNNAYNQDSEVTWFDWAQADEELIAFCAQAIAMRKRFAQLRCTGWLTGLADLNDRRDVVWFNRLGDEMTAPQWTEANRFVFGMLLDGTPPLLALFNAEARDWPYPLPDGAWQVVMDTGERRSFDPVAQQRDADGKLLLKARSLTVLHKVA